MADAGPKTESREEAYFLLIRDAVRKCREYRPKFGLGGAEGQTLASFTRAYAQDPFYHWLGLDSPLVYAAHKAAGGITSIYRQIGIACQWVFSRVLQDSLGLTPEESTWTYRVPSTRKDIQRKLSLDGRIPIQAVRRSDRIPAIRSWIREAAGAAALDKKEARSLEGAVFEVRQGYKSADSKRQNADISNAANAYARRYLPVVALFSLQIPGPIAERYVRAQWVLLRGSLAGTPIDSTYVFSREVLGFDLAGFFTRNSARIKTEVESVLTGLLQ